MVFNSVVNQIFILIVQHFNTQVVESVIKNNQIG